MKPTHPAKPEPSPLDITERERKAAIEGAQRTMREARDYERQQNGKTATRNDVAGFPSTSRNGGPR